MSVVVAGTAALIATTCAAGDLEPPATPAPPAPVAAAEPSAVPTAQAVPPATDAAPAASASEPAPSPASKRPALPRFRQALRALSRGEAKQPVRIAWLGDSHTYADFWTHAVRARLQRSFGNGGPGFVNLGMPRHRHGQLKIESTGKWRREPSQPASSTRSSDGNFGLGGIRSIPTSPDALCRIEPLGKVPSGPASYELVFRAKAGESFSLQVGGAPRRRIDGSAGSPLSGSGLRHLVVDSPSLGPIEIGYGQGSPELFGMFVELQGPGLVLDRFGINGARAATALAWNEAAFSAELARRNPALVVLAYGTNEAASQLRAERFEQQVTALVQRIQAAAAQADCIVAGPTDMATPDGGSRPRVALLDSHAERAALAAGCAYFSPYQAMGGEGSFARWMSEKPALAARDRIHLTPQGYQRLGERFVEWLAANK